MNSGRVFIDGIFYDQDLFAYAVGRIMPEQIADKLVRAVYHLVYKEWSQHQLTPNWRTFPDLVSRRVSSEASARKLLEYMALQESRVPDTQTFYHAVRSLLDDGKKAKLYGNINAAIDLMGKNMLDGIEDVLLSGMDSYTPEGSDEGDARACAPDALDRYAEETLPGVPTGVEMIDDLTGGGHPGQLWVFAGYTADGKTQVMKEFAYNAVTAGRNVVWITMEMERSEMEDLFIVRHSHAFCEGGLRGKRVELKMLDEQEMGVLEETVNDWHTNELYGQLFIWRPNRNATVRTMETKLLALSRYMDIGMVVVDYMELFRPEKRRAEYRIELGEKAERMKRVAADMGLFMLSGAQISRAGYEKACKRGYYMMADLAESAGIERNASLIAWVLRTEEQRELHKARIGVAKYRHGGDCIRGWEVDEDYAHGRIGT